MSAQHAPHDDERDPAATYADRAREADTVFGRWYWEARFIGHVAREVAVETPGLLRDDLARARRFLAGDAEPVGPPCTIADCDRDAAAYLNGGRPYATRRPVCERHYLAVKGVTYGIIGFFGLLFAATLVSMVVVWS